MATPTPPLLLPILLLLLPSLGAEAEAGGGGGGGGEEEGRWCVARSDATTQELQRALDYACGGGADCTPLQPSGLCFLPNNIQAHASYAFNSFFQRKAMAPGSCDFSGTANVATTDPSYGSCVYPASLSAAGGTATSIPPPSNPNIGMIPTPTGPTYGGSGTSGTNPGTLPTDNSEASLPSTARPMLFMTIVLLLLSAL